MTRLRFCLTARSVRRLLLKDMLPHIRFPLFDVTQLAALLSGTNLVSEQAMVALYTHVATRVSDTKVLARSRRPRLCVCCASRAQARLEARRLALSTNSVGHRRAWCPTHVQHTAQMPALHRIRHACSLRYCCVLRVEPNRVGGRLLRSAPQSGLERAEVQCRVSQSY